MAARTRTPPSSTSRPDTAPASRVNRRSWDRSARRYEQLHRAVLRREHGLAWGLFRLPERTVRLLDPVRGKDVLELGCGAADWSVALERLGGRVTGLDFSHARLSQARRRVRRAHAHVRLVRGNAERVPFANGRFDLVLSDYGATAFADPRRYVPEVARILRPGGQFVFAHASTYRTLTHDLRSDRLGTTLRRDYFDLHEFRTPDGVEFQLPLGEWTELFRRVGFAVERFLEPRAPARGRTSYLSAADRAWARRWPVEMIWALRRGPPGRRSGRA
jgi:ubiquinone/menaquinone biosynthesis C-methylase UbiE